jgi:NADPH:quinone reductase-like Zn-dependent oxidoreductase
VTETNFYAAIQLQQTDSLTLKLILKENLPIPAQLKSNQVLIKMIYAAVNPSDFMVIRGQYVVKKTLPAVPGTVGVGVVIATGSAIRSRWLKGKRVACAGNYTGDGTWGQYMPAANTSVMPLQKRISNEVGANLLSNPNTALALFHGLKKRRVKCFIQTAAASDIGQLLQCAAREHRIQVINIVRKQEDVDLLQLKFRFPTLNSSAVNFDRELETITKRFQPTVFLDAVSGEMTSRIAQALGTRGQIILYGMLPERDPVIDEGVFSRKDLRLETFSIMRYLENQSLPGMLRYVLQLQNFGQKYTGAIIRGIVSLPQLMRDWPDYEKQSGLGKYLLDPFKTG